MYLEEVDVQSQEQKGFLVLNSSLVTMLLCDWAFT